MCDYKEKCLNETMQFFFLCGEKDEKILLSRKKKDKISELARLGVIALVFGYRTTFVRIFGEAQRYFDEFTKGLDLINGNFPLLNEWVEKFIENIRDGEAKALVQELWQERKKTLDRSDLLIKHLFKDI